MKLKDLLATIATIDPCYCPDIICYDDSDGCGYLTSAETVADILENEDGCHTDLLDSIVVGTNVYAPEIICIEKNLIYHNAEMAKDFLNGSVNMDERKMTFYSCDNGADFCIEIDMPKEYKDMVKEAFATINDKEKLYERLSEITDMAQDDDDIWELFRQALNEKFDTISKAFS